jgi:hypothetical protein
MLHLFSIGVAKYRPFDVPGRAPRGTGFAGWLYRLVGGPKMDSYFGYSFRYALLIEFVVSFFFFWLRIECDDGCGRCGRCFESGQSLLDKVDPVGVYTRAVLRAYYMVPGCVNLPETLETTKLSVTVKSKP